MDRSFLSDANVVDASRNFVCIRLATYEDQSEAEFLESIYVGRSGQLENTTFAILAPDGKRKLTAAGRAPFHAFRGATSMSDAMQRIAAEYAGAENFAGTDVRLPLMKNLELALNVAAADEMPLIVVVGDSQEHLDRLQKKLVRLAWNREFAGQFVYATAAGDAELKPVTGVQAGRVILVVEPGQFGLSGKVVAQFAADEGEQDIESELRAVLKEFPRHGKDHDAHIRLGIGLGIDWQSEIPETDPQSIRAKQRARSGQ